MVTENDYNNIIEYIRGELLQKAYPQQEGSTYWVVDKYYIESLPALCSWKHYEQSKMKEAVEKLDTAMRDDKRELYGYGC